MKMTKLLRIHGRVQGVFFRESLVAEARRAGITGWVRNRQDGTVEALVQGEKESVEEIIRWCHRGPPLASVTEVKIGDAPGVESWPDFARKETE